MSDLAPSVKSVRSTGHGDHPSRAIFGLFRHCPGPALQTRALVQGLTTEQAPLRNADLICEKQLLDHQESSGSVKHHGRRLREIVVFGLKVKRSSFQITLNALGLQSRKLGKEFPSREELSNFSNKRRQLPREASVLHCGFRRIRELLHHQIVER